MPHISTYVALLHRGEQTLADSFHLVGEGHAKEADVFHTCSTLAQMSERHVAALAPVARRYGEQSRGEDIAEPGRLHAEGVAEIRQGPVGLLRDLQDLTLLATLVQTSWTCVAQAAQGLRDHELLDIAVAANAETSRQLSWLNTRMKAAAPQALIVAS